MKRYVFAVLFAFAAMGGAFADMPPLPQWWPNEIPRTPPTPTPENYRPANLGQLKHMATLAKAHLDATLVDGAGFAVESMVASFGPDDGSAYTQAERDENYRPVNIGQVKAVAKPFYDRLMAAGYDSKGNLSARLNATPPAVWAFDVPWNPSTAKSENYSPANIGQLKFVFSFDLTNFDIDQDGISDAWETVQFGGLGQTGSGDFDGDGVVNRSEFLYGGNPKTSDTDGDGDSDAQEITAGTNPADANEFTPRRIGYFPMDSESAGTPTFLDGNGQAPTSKVGVEQVTGRKGKAARLNESADLLSYPRLRADGSPNIALKRGTVRFWFRPEWLSSGTPGNYARFIQLGQNSSDRSIAQWKLMFQPENHKVLYTLNSGTNTASYSEAHYGLGDHTGSGGNGWLANTWHQFAFTYSPTGRKLFIDGVLMETVAASPISEFRLSDFDATGIMIGTDGSNPIKGTLDEVEFFNHELTEDQIAADYDADVALGVDANGNGLPDGWDTTHFAGITEKTGAQDDYDDDGLTNLEEWQRGTDPKDTDTDYDGRSDAMEVADGTDPTLASSVKQIRLGHFPMSTTDFLSSVGSAPLQKASGVGVGSGRIGKGLDVQYSGGTNQFLRYRDVEAGGKANINFLRGTIRLWYKPYWSSNSSGTPSTSSPLIACGVRTTNASQHYWALTIEPTGVTMKFLMQDANGNTIERLSEPLARTPETPLGFEYNKWYEIVLVYGPSTSKLYINGVLRKTGSGATSYPSAPVRTLGFSVGTDRGGNDRVWGTVDEVETFNYELTQAQIEANYAKQVALGVDTDSDGLSDAWEMLKFGNLLHPGYEDFDNDGWTNLDEFKRNTNPSVADRTPGTPSPKPGKVWAEQNASGGNDITWAPTTSGEVTVQTSTDGITWTTVGHVSGSTGTFTDPTANPEAPAFYRVGSPGSWSSLAASDPDGDFDGDGLSNQEEADSGTNPGSNDSDGDGVQDGKDGWALASKLSPPRLGPTSYAVVPLDGLIDANARYQINNKGDVLAIGYPNQIWQIGAVKNLPNDFWPVQLTDKGEVVGGKTVPVGSRAAIWSAVSMTEVPDYLGDLSFSPDSADDWIDLGNDPKAASSDGAIYSILFTGWGDANIDPAEPEAYRTRLITGLYQKVPGTTYTPFYGIEKTSSWHHTDNNGASVTGPESDPVVGWMVQGVYEASNSGAVILDRRQYYRPPIEGAAWPVGDPERGIVDNGVFKSVGDSDVRHISDGKKPWAVGGTDIFTKEGNGWVKSFPDAGLPQTVFGGSRGVNSRGEIVGLLNNAEGETGQLIRDQKVIDLNASTADWHIEEVVGINEGGMMVGSAKKVRDEEGEAIPVGDQEQKAIMVVPLSVDYIARDPHTGEFTNLGGLLAEAQPMPEVKVSAQSVSVASNGTLTANIQIEVRDPLSEISATNKLNELTIYVNEEPYETIGGLASQAQGTTVPIWQPNRSKVVLNRTVTIADVPPGVVTIRVQTGANAAGNVGWGGVGITLAKAMTQVAAIAPAHTAAFTIAGGSLSPTAVNQVSLSIDGSSAGTLTETSASSDVFAGTVTTSSGSRTVALWLESSPQPGQVASGFIRGTLDISGESDRLIGLWQNSSGTYSLHTAYKWDEANRSTLYVAGVSPLQSSPEDDLQPFVVRVTVPESLAEQMKKSDSWLKLQMFGAAKTLVEGNSLDTGEQPPPGIKYLYVSEGGKPKIHALVNELAGELAPQDVFDDEEFRVELTANSGTVYDANAAVELQPAPQAAQSRVGPQLMSLSSEPKYTVDEVCAWYKFFFGKYGELLLDAYLTSPINGTIQLESMSRVVHWGGYRVENWMDSDKVAGRPFIIHIDDDFPSAARAAQALFAALNDCKGWLGRTDFRTTFANVYQQAAFEDADGVAFYQAYNEGSYTPIVQSLSDCSTAAQIGLSIINVGADIAFTVNDVMEDAKKGEYKSAATTAVLGVLFTAPVAKLAKRTGKKIVIQTLDGNVELTATIINALSELTETARRHEVIKKLRPLIQSGEITPEGVRLIYSQTKLLSESRDILAENLEDVGRARPSSSSKYVAHHLLPIVPKELDEPMELKFLLAGLDPNDPEFGEWVTKEVHSKIHGKGTSGQRWGAGGPWNYQWKQFFAESNVRSEAEVRDLFNQLKEVLEDVQKNPGKPISEFNWRYFPQ